MEDFTKYAAAHEKQNGPGDQRPTALQIIDDNRLRGAWSDKVVFVTGASSGIGVPTVQAFAATGAKVYAAARDLNKAKTALSHLSADQLARVELVQLDLASLESVRQAAKTFLSMQDKLNILVNNAGIMAVQTLELTKDGFESQFATNHLGHFLLFQLLEPALLAASSSNFNSRVVNVTSLAHRFYEPDFNDVESKKPDAYNPWNAYAVSKTANIWTANEIERRYGSGSPAGSGNGQVIHGFAVHPGGIQSGLQVHSMDVLENILADSDGAKMLKSAEQGAATTVWAAAARVWEGKGGKYLEDCQIGSPLDPALPAWSHDPGHASWAFDEDKAKKMWEISSAMVGIESA